MTTFSKVLRDRFALGRLMLVAVMLVGASAAQAAMITYSLSGTATGTAGAQSFNGSAFAFTLTSDTSLLTASGNVALTPSSAIAFTIGGVGSGFTSGMTFGSNFTNGIMGISTGPVTPALTGSGGPIGYDLTTALSPTALTVFNSSLTGIATTLGALTLTNVRSLTFSATLVQVPEPATLGLLAISLLGVGFARRKRAG